MTTEKEMKTQHPLSRLYVVILLATVCCFLWGSAFPCVKLGYERFGIGPDDVASRILFAGIRFFMAGILTVVIGSAGSRSLLVPKKADLKSIAILSFFQTIGQYFFFYGGLANTSGVKSSIIGGTNTFITILVAVFIFRQEKMTGRKIIGCVLGFLGIVLINLNPEGLAAPFRLTGDGFILMSNVLGAFGAVYLKRFGKNSDPVMLSGYQFVLGGAVLAAAGALAGGHLDNMSPAGGALLLYMAMISAVAYSVWGLLLKYNPVSGVVIFGFLTPVFGVLLSSLILREANESGVWTFAALALVSAGIAIVAGKREA